MSNYHYGIDVSKYQGNIDFKKVKADGIEFVILKVTNKDNSIEPSFERNYKNAIAAGLEVGVYKYVYANNKDQALAEGLAVYNAIKGKKIACGFWIDMEDSSIKNLGKNKLTEIINHEAWYMRANKIPVGIYCNKDWHSNVLDSTTLINKYKYPFWIARYPSADNGTIKESLNPLDDNKRISVWQYSSKGKVAGISGNVDKNVCKYDLANVMKLYTGV